MLEINKSTKGNLSFLLSVEKYLLANGYKRHSENEKKINKTDAIGISWSKTEYWFFKSKTSKSSIPAKKVENVIKDHPTFCWF